MLSVPLGRGITSSIAALLSLAGCAAPGSRPAGDEAAGPAYQVEWVGEMRAVHLDGDAGPRLSLERIESRAGAFAIGPLAGLRGEITVVDGEAYIARADDSDERVERGFDHDAPFLVFGHVLGWQPVPLPDELRDLADLEPWLAEAARAHGLDRPGPFPFKIESATSAIDYHVISNPDGGDRITRPHGELMRKFNVDAEPMTIIGVYSTDHGGVFTHHGQATHMHMVTTDGRRSGHVDRLTLGAGSTLHLPRP